MPFDALTYKIAAKELDSTLSGGRIERIGMPNKDEAVISVRPKDRTKRGSVLLLLSANPSRPRVHITSRQCENPLSAFSFLMHLRKHIGGGTITEITALPYERIIRICIEAADELGYKKAYRLYAELLGRYSNLILTDERGIITDCIRHISFDDFSERAVLPGLEYKLPPAQADKFSPEETQKITDRLAAFSGGNLSDYMMSGIYGFAPSSMRQITFDAYGTLTPEKETVLASPEKFTEAMAEISKAYAPCVLESDGRIRECFIKPYTYLESDFTAYKTLNEAMEAYFSSAEENGYMAGKTAHLAAVVRNAVKKNQKSLAAYRERILSSGDYELDRIKGELLTANIYRFKGGADKDELDNYYTGEKTEISLDPKLSPQSNAQKYFKSYNKKKTAIAKSEEQAAAAEERGDYYESLLAALSNAENEGDVAEISAEMEAAGLLKRIKNKKKLKPAQPIKLKVDGYTVLIGKNNVQNDAIVRSSDGGWLWLHTQKIHGSHGVIQGCDIPQNTVNKVASYVAHYSKAALSANVPVDYTLIKYVKKPSGSPPGKVIYTHQQTVNVTPKKPNEV